MFWNKIAPVYDVFEKVYNNKVIKGTAKTWDTITLPMR